MALRPIAGPVCKVSVAYIGKRVLVVFGDNFREHRELLKDGVHYVTRGARQAKGGFYRPAGGNSIAGLGRAYFLSASFGLGDISKL